jgi:hypothetical protein
MLTYFAAMFCAFACAFDYWTYLTTGKPLYLALAVFMGLLVVINLVLASRAK